MVAAPESLRRVELHPASGRSEGLPHEFDVLVWNVEKTKKRGWSDEFARLDRAAELVLLQEGRVSRTLRDVFETSSDEWWMGVSFHYVARDDTRVPTGVVTVAPVASISAEVIHSPTREPLVATPKATLLTEYPLTGSEETLLVVNVHAINFRRAEHLAAQLEPLRAPIEEHAGPVILAGDFNTHHRPRLEVLERFVRDLGLTVVFPNRTIGPRGRERLVRDGRPSHLGFPLDHAYVRGLTVSDAKVHAWSNASDHAPLTFRVTR